MMTTDTTNTPATPPGKLTPAVWAVLAFTVLYLLPVVILVLVKGNLEFIIYIVVIVVAIVGIRTVHLRVNLTLGALWALSLWGLSHMLGGMVPVPANWPIEGDSHVLYNLWLIGKWLKYDNVVHVYGFGVTTWVCWQALRATVKDAEHLRPTFGRMVLCVAAGMGFGALNEVIEFLATLTLPDTNVGDYRNNAWDLVANLIGTTTVAVWIWWREGGRREAETSV